MTEKVSSKPFHLKSAKYRMDRANRAMAILEVLETVAPCDEQRRTELMATELVVLRKHIAEAYHFLSLIIEEDES